VASNDRYVRQADDGSWEILARGHRRSAAQASTERDAITRAKRQVRQEGGGEVRVLNRAGKIVRSDTVKRAAARRTRKPA
jgi:uncharacterized protein DUF2188